MTPGALTQLRAVLNHMSFESVMAANQITSLKIKRVNNNVFDVTDAMQLRSEYSH